MKYYFPSPLGVICLTGDGTAITSLELNVHHSGDFTGTGYWEVFRIAEKQLTEYFQGKRREFDLPIKPIGTKFQLSVWEQVSRIPYGSVLSYGEIASLIEKPTACRAVGNAVGANPLPIIVPCHRVVSAKGIGGFSCGLAIKRKLMAIEGIVV